jgi:hypothetical protein
MNELSPNQVDFIKREVGKAGLTYSHLQDELTDHLCCDIENEMQMGIPFEKACERILDSIGYEGLQKIQENTLYLIDKQYRIMKNTIKVSGLIAPILLAMGALFKLNHWPAASILLTLGFFTLCFIFLPNAVLVSFKELNNRKKLFTHLSGFIGAFFGSLTFLFKIQHWPGAYIMQIISLIAVSGLFMPSFFLQLIKNAKSQGLKICYWFGLFGSVSFSAGISFKILAFEGALMLLTFGVIILIAVAFPLFVINYYRNRESVSPRFVFLTFVVVWGVIPFMLLKINVSDDVQSYLYTKFDSFSMNEIEQQNSNDSIFFQINHSNDISDIGKLNSKKIHEETSKIRNQINSALDIMENNTCLTEEKIASLKFQIAQYCDSLTCIVSDKISNEWIRTILILKSDEEFSWEKPRLQLNLFASKAVLLSVLDKVNKSEYIALNSIVKK